MKPFGLYSPEFEHDSCGVGFIADINGDASHQIVSDGINILQNLIHRGAVGGDLKTGDGAGILTQIPHRFFAEVCKQNGFNLPGRQEYGAGMLFLPQDKDMLEQCRQITNNCIVSEGGTVLGWRQVPAVPDCLGEFARNSMPSVWQIFAVFPKLSGETLERRLYIVRKSIEKKASDSGFSIDDFYVVSFSCRTINYKGMFVAPQLPGFYPDLQDPDFQSAIALVHQRYSTNTFPSWPLAQPFRYICHNGEINTLRGNANKMTAREATISSSAFGDEIKKLIPVITPTLSDSGMFDNVYELLCLSGRTPEHSMMIMIPEAFGTKYHISQDKRSFYEYHAAIMEPWDGPAAIAFSDGLKVGGILDRNGLRPARYAITKSGRIVMASEAGVIDIPAKEVLEKGRLAPGKMILVDTEKKRIVYDSEIKASVSRKRPYRRWLESNRIELKGLFGTPGLLSTEGMDIVLMQKIFGYTLEEIKMIIAPMAENAQEPIGSMGNDTALAVLAERPQLLYNYFKQLFAQVTNPPIDPYRENLVMSLMSFIGREGNLLDETPEHCHQLKLTHPILSNDDIEKLKKTNLPGIKTGFISILFNAADGEQGFKNSIERICSEAENLVDTGSTILVLSDRGASGDRAPLPALLALSAAHHFLIRKKKRHLAGLIIETAEAREVMHFATLIGYGASAINPYLAFETIADLIQRKLISDNIQLETAFDHYITAVNKGLLKIMSKMGISTIRSYRGAQIFEAVGLNKEFIDDFFPGTPSRIEGIGLDAVAKETLERHSQCFAQDRVLQSGGRFNYRKNSEKHLLTPEAIVSFQNAVKKADYAEFKKYSSQINDSSRNLCTIRGLLKFKPQTPIDIDEVEPVEEIVKRFVSSAMSFGSISRETHETIAIAMNRLGAASNSGEGGEDEKRYTELPNGDSTKSAVKQVASGRFGVTINYLVNSSELQIKMAQGAKPGEGGQLPGHKVNEEIASVRHSTPGVMLISPPPHHDIYSIEDLAQLIFDLKNANRQARISVKLVSEVGVGTVAAGVAKGKADMVLISGHDGGTGASPISSIQHAGIPWEIGLAETQQTLVLNNLRERIRVQTDGQLKTGRDIVIAAMLGAEEFGFGTLSLMAMGCVMMRKCHLNTCPVGVATQDHELRKRFAGKPEYLENCMRFIAQEVREIMASLGIKKMDDLIGRADLLEADYVLKNWKAMGVDLSKLLMVPVVPSNGSLRHIKSQEHDFSLSLDLELIEQAEKAIQACEPVYLFATIRNCNRTAGAMLSSEVAKIYGSKGLPPDTIKCKFSGSAGQSFGAFLAPGITFELEGETNDYTGKGLSGGKIIVYPPKDSTFSPKNNIIAGNVALFGATNGEVYINGMAGERFAVRNSGAVAVVEGVGDHGCEYMTGGCVVVLGRTGVNFAAGMSGGIAYVLDENQLFDTQCNLEMVDVEPLTEEEDKIRLLNLIEKHIKYTESQVASEILRNWSETLPKFVKVMPLDYKKALERISRQTLRESDSVEMTEEVYD